MVDPANREETDAPSARSARVRTVGESSTRRGGEGRDSGGRSSRGSRGGSRRGRRPEPVSGRPGAGRSGGSARFVAPIALAIFVIACFSVLSSSGDDTKAPTKSEKSSSSSSTDKNTSGSGSGSVTVTTKKTYTVKAGDSFAAIAEKLNVNVDTLQQLNPDVDPRALQPGEKLKLR
ncbi:MAG: LysM peptidoglycan-binding domain-containing protein [Solirubrobacterales bacterium]